MLPALHVEGLRVSYGREGTRAPAVDGVDLTVAEGEVLGLVGESGSGKTTVASAILRMLPRTAGVSGSVSVGGRDVFQMSPAELRATRGGLLSLVPQNPMASLNPVLSVGYQLVETIRCHNRINRSDAAQAAVTALRRVKVPDPERALKRYPHEFSGGTRQRILIAAALVNSPRLIVADEPTSALDATVQRQIVDLLGGLVRSRSMAMLLISHDLGVVARLADRIAVMYAGQVVEIGSTAELLDSPRHPYTVALLAAARAEAAPVKSSDVEARLLATCRFLPRCPIAIEACGGSAPQLAQVAPGHGARCYAAQGVGSPGGGGD